MTKEQFIQYINSFPEMVTFFDQEGHMHTIQEWHQWTFNGSPPSPNAITQNFSLNETKFKQDLAQYGKLNVCVELMFLLQAIRFELGEAITITSFNRNEAKQAELQKNPNYKAAGTSPHVYFMAADIVPASVIKAKTTADKTRAIKAAAERIWPIIRKRGGRMGVDQYIANGQHFIHIDMCPVFFGPGKLINEGAMPPPWKISQRW
jgi:hypothetical protein